MKILHLEDSITDSEMICDALREEQVEFELFRVETRRAFIDALAQPGWEIILSDFSLPSFDGIAALKLAVEKLPEVPFIFVTGALGEELAVETLRNGATDYILKHRLDRLGQAVTRAKRESETALARKEAEEKIKNSLREKELLLQEVHHRVKNNLQIICSLLSMQSAAGVDAATISALQESQKRVHSMAMIHEMLYSSSSLNDLDFAEYAEMLAFELSNSYGVDGERIRMVFGLEPMRLEIDRAIPCGLILNELLTNALKYAFPGDRRGEIRILLQKSEGRIKLTVKDNGIGMPQGPHPRQSRSLGLRIVHILAKQVGAVVEITSDQGTDFSLSFRE